MEALGSPWDTCSNMSLSMLPLKISNPPDGTGHEATHCIKLVPSMRRFRSACEGMLHLLQSIFKADVHVHERKTTSKKFQRGSLVGAARGLELSASVLADDATQDGQRDCDERPDEGDDHNGPKWKCGRGLQHSTSTPSACMQTPARHADFNSFQLPSRCNADLATRQGVFSLSALQLCTIRSTCLMNMQAPSKTLVFNGKAINHCNMRWAT